MPGKKTMLRKGAIAPHVANAKVADGSGMDAQVEDILFSVASPVGLAEGKENVKPPNEVEDENR
jgi:hypothetical protein